MNCALWYINCRGIKVASKSLSRDFKAVQTHSINSNGNNNDTHALKKIRFQNYIYSCVCVGCVALRCDQASAQLKRSICYYIFLFLHFSVCFTFLCRSAVRCVHGFSHTEQDLQVEINAQTISAYRYLWLNLSELLQALGNAYARTYSTYCLFM